jgi:hypothetical protein
MGRRFEAPMRIDVVLPKALKTRLSRQAAKETIEKGKAVRISDIVRWAVEDYLDYFEPAAFDDEATVDEVQRSFQDMKHQERGQPAPAPSQGASQA